MANADTKVKKKDPAKASRIIRILLLLVIFAVILAGALSAMTIRINEITYSGNTYYTDEELTPLIFSKDSDYLTAYAWICSRTGKNNTIPFIDKYKVKITGLHSAKVMIYEKAVAGCVECMGSYMYFDNDGYVVECSGEREGTIPVITGLKYKSVVLNEQITVDDPEIFREILNISQGLSASDLTVDYVAFASDGTVSLVVGNITCTLGEYEYLTEKIGEFADMLPQLSGKKGTVHLEDYDPSVKNPSYPFISRK